MTHQNGLVAHWPLAKDAKDVVGSNHGDARNVRFVDLPAHLGEGAASFLGRGAAVQVPDASGLRLGNGDFSITLRVRPEAPIRSPFGDLLNKFDEAQRCGVNLWIAGSAPAYNSMSDTRPCALWH